LERRQAALEPLLGLPQGALKHLQGLFGVSGICNILGSIRMARQLQLGVDDNVVTIATDGFDRYPSVLRNLEHRRGPLPESQLGECFEEVFRACDLREILDLRPREQKERLFGYKEQVWTAFNYPRSYLARMQSQSFWDEEFEKVREIDTDLLRARSAG